MSGWTNIPKVECQHCHKLQYLRLIEIHERSCLENPELFAALKIWAQANCKINENGDRVFPSLKTYQQTKPTNAPHQRVIQKTVGNWPEFGELIAPDMIVNGKGHKDGKKTNDILDSPLETKLVELGKQYFDETYCAHGLPYKKTYEQKHYTRSGRYIRDEIVYCVR